MEEIQPRPLSLEPIQPRPIPARGHHEQAGATEADRLLKAIVNVARKPESLQTRMALRLLVVRCSREIALDF